LKTKRILLTLHRIQNILRLFQKVQHFFHYV